MSTFPATNSNEAVELVIDGGNQLHQIINEDATTEIQTESGPIPSVRKALADTFLFLDPIPWQVGSDEIAFNQLRVFDTDIYWAPSATLSAPVPMGATPIGDSNWKLAPLDRDHSKLTNRDSSSSHPATAISTLSGDSVEDVLENKADKTELSNIIEIPPSTADSALAIRSAISLGKTFLLLPGVHYFRSTITNADGREVFAELPDFSYIRTASKNTELRPTVSAYAFFTPTDVAASDIYFDTLRAFGVAEGTTSPRLVNKFLAARDGDEGRIVRLEKDSVETVDFDQGVDSYSWSTMLQNTDSGFCGVGYNFRKGEQPPTSLRLIGSGATSCNTCFNIERTTYSTMLNCFSDDTDVGVVVKEASNMDIINHGFEYSKQLFELGTDDLGVTVSNGLNVKGAFVFQRVRKGFTDSEVNYSDWGARALQLKNSTLDFSGIDNDWFIRNKRNFLYLKGCSNIVIDGMPRECVVVDYSGGATYYDITAGDKSFNLDTDFFISRLGSDENMGSISDPFLTFDKVDFVLGDDLLTRRKVTFLEGVDTPLILRNKGWRKSSQGDDNTPRLTISGDNNYVSGIKLASIFGNLNDVLIEDLQITADGHISDCTGIVLNNITIPVGVTLYISGGNVTFTNLTINGALYCQRGAQVKISSATGSGDLTSASAVVYTAGVTGITENKIEGGQIFN